MKNLKIHDYKSLKDLHWDEYHNGDYAKAFLLPFLQYGPNHFIDNINTKMLAVTVDNFILPITINNAEYENSYVCSPYTHYITYALEELRLIQNSFIRVTLKGVIRTLGKLFKIGKINKNVIVNNWLVSTNLYPPLTQHQIERITRFLSIQFPEHAIVFRSLNGCLNDDLLNAFRKNEYHLLLSRQIYFLNTFDDEVFSSKHFKQDIKLLKGSGYVIEDSSKFSENDIPRIVDLYNQLYLDKYSLLNPQFNSNFVKLALKEKILTIKAIRKDSQPIDGVLGYFQNCQVMTTPLFGYDTTKPKEDGLYRLISTILALEAREKQHYLHRSSGVAHFKTMRKATPHIEYTGVYPLHLPCWRKLPWKILYFVTQKCILPLMKKYKL